MVIPRERLSEARKEFAANGVTASIVKAARQYFDVLLPEHEWGGKFHKNGERVFKPRKFPDDHIKSQITSPIWRDAVSALCRAYLLTGEQTYGVEALRWSLRVATFDVLPESNLDFCGNPYPDSFCFAFYLDCMACAYDCLQDFMTEQQREMVRVNLAERLRIGYEYYCNRLENRCIDNHAWQISVGAFVRAVITAKGDVPEADRYLAYIYNVWRARDPEQSRTDGGWFGGGYVGVNIGAWTEVPTYFSRYSGHNFYDHPFYHSQPYWFLYRQPPGSHEDGFSGDGYGGNSRGIGEKIALWMGLLDAALDHPVAGWLADSAEIRREEKWRTFAWARQAAGLPLRSPRRAPAPVDLPQARAFRDIGIVNMHRDLLNPQDDLHVALRSSPYGTFGHNLASHNAFNVVYRGDYLFVPYGHRHGGAKNSAACYRHTRGHNSVLVNGKGQPFSPEAYGWIARFLHGKRVSYACGDASNAYDAAPFERETKLFGAADLAIDDHISRGKVTHFRRHLLFLRPSLIVVYDELEANEPVRWDWVLHCRHVMRAEDARLTVDGVDATVDVRGSTPMLATVKTKSIFQAVNVDGRGGQERNTPYPVEGSHAYVSSSAKTDRLRILALVQVGAQHQIEGENGQLTCGEWELAAEMDPGRLANLRVSTTAKTARFVLKTPETGASVLTETVAGTSRTFRAVDEIPYAARGVELLSAHSQERKKP